MEAKGCVTKDVTGTQVVELRKEMEWGRVYGIKLGVFYHTPILN